MALLYVHIMHNEHWYTCRMTRRIAHTQKDTIDTLQHVQFKGSTHML